MNLIFKSLRAIVSTLEVFGLSIALSTGVAAQEQRPTNYIDCSRYENTGYADEDGNDKADGVTARALARTMEENNARLCSGLPIYTGDLRMPIMSIWDSTTNIRYSVFGDRPNGHQDNGTTRMSWITYPGSPTPLNSTPLFAELATTTNGNATFGRAAASILPAATNGIGAAVVNTAFSPCRNGGCGSGGNTVVNMVDGAEALAVNTATAASASESNVATSFGSCATGICGAPVSTPAQAATVNPSQQGSE